MATNYVAHFNFKGVNNEFLKQLMINEFIRAYNYYCDKTNGGITDQLNMEFDDLFPNYELDDKEYWKNTEYNRFMANGYQKRIVDAMNYSRFSWFMDFYVDPEEVIFVGCLRWNHNATIDFYVKQEES